MPELSRFYGIVIRMYYNDHEPPHFHAAYAGASARIEIESLAILSGALPPRALGLAMEWAAMHRSDLLAAWRRVQQFEAPGKVEPLP
ncbi:MAG: DUF4160 domain-containing protein [Gemmatimonadota bacterium]